MSLLTLYQLNLVGTAPPLTVLPFREYTVPARVREYTAGARNRDFTAPVRVREYTAGA